MIYLVIITSIVIAISFFKDKEKTLKGLKLGFKKFSKIIIPFVIMLILVSFAQYFISGDTISKYLINSKSQAAYVISLIIGSISVMPGFIAFPLSGILRQNGISYMIISAFTSTLMMVGIVTYPIEKKYFGTQIALTRNVVSFVIAVIVSIVTGFFFGEII